MIQSSVARIIVHPVMNLVARHEWLARPVRFGHTGAPQSEPWAKETVSKLVEAVL